MGYDIETLFDIANEEIELAIKQKDYLSMFEQFQKLKDYIVNRYILRMECFSFLMIIDTETNTYYNLYLKDFNKNYFQFLVDILNKHEKIKEI